MVTARDGALDPRLATATVTVKVIDIEDELPVFHVPTYEVKVPENVPDYTVIQVKVGTTKRVERRIWEFCAPEYGKIWRSQDFSLTLS